MVSGDYVLLSQTVLCFGLWILKFAQTVALTSTKRVIR